MVWTLQNRPDTSPHRATRTLDEERGVALVEFAFVAMILFVLAAGAFDYGMAWRAGLAVNEASRTGARVGSAMGEEPTADYYALSGAKSALDSSNKLDLVERVVIFQASSASGTIPDQCKTAATTGLNCVIVDGATFRSGWTLDDFNAEAGENGCFNLAQVRNWCPGHRESRQLDADYIGIWIKYKQDHFFPVTGDHAMIERQTVMRIEPLVES